MSNRVAICIPSQDMVHADFAMCLAALCYNPGAPVALINNKGSLPAFNRDEGVRLAREYGCSHVLFLDTDMQFPRDLLKRLLKHDKDIVGATYIKRTPPHNNLAKPLNNETTVVDLGLHEVQALPTGLLLIKTSVFDNAEFPYFRTPVIPDGNGGLRLQGEDYYFCESARARGHSIWLDVELSYECGHIGQQVFRIQDYERPH